MLRDIYLIARHVPGKTNTMADRESREFKDEAHWNYPQVIQPFLSGCRTDLFTTRLTHQLKRYITLHPDPEAHNYDALSVNWSGLGGYAFPPKFNMVPAVLNKVLTDEIEIVLVAPVWQTQTWCPLLLILLTQERLFFRADHTFCRIQQIHNRYTHVYPTPPPGRVSCLLQSYRTEGLSKDVANLLVVATRTSTSKTNGGYGGVGAAGVV